MIKLFVILGFSFFNPPADSLRQEIIDGKIFVIHQVEEKETLYALSRRYGATVADIIQYNPSTSAGLEIGQILKIPYVKPKTVSVPAGSIVHKVAEKETLYSISRLYNVSVDDVKKWNNLSDASLSIGQEIVIRKNGSSSVQPSNPPASVSGISQSARKGTHTVAASQTLYSIARDYGVTVEQLRAWNKLTGNELSVGQVLFVTQPAYSTTTQTTSPSQPVTTQETTANTSTPVQASTQPVQSQQQPVQNAPAAQTNPAPITITESVKGSDEVVESGLAELIEGTEGNRKYLALHRTAPVGTILKIRNEMNNREVFVRVMGKLPDTALTNNLIIKISRSAYDRLGAIDQRFRVQITYYK